MNGSSQKQDKSTKVGIRGLKEQIRFPLFRRLSTRLLFTLTMLSALPLIIVGLFMRSVAQETITEYIKIQHSQIARRAGNEIRLFLETPSTLLKVLLETKDIVDMNPFTQKLILNKVISEYQPIFDRVFTIDTLGFEFTSSDFKPHSINYTKEDFFVRGKRGESYFSLVMFNDAQEPFVRISHPIQRLDQVVGYLVAEINLKSIWELVDEIMVGETGYAFVVSSSGQLIAHPDKKKVINRDQVIDPALIAGARETPLQSQVFESTAGVMMLGTFAYLKGLNWIIIIQQPVEEAFSVASTMLYQVFAFVALVIMLAVLLAYLLEKRITAPINTLINGTKRYADGDLDFRIKIERYEEIAVLAREFNSMAAGLQENQKKLRRAEHLAAMSKFATLVSHEIRNPLNSMNINMQILKREMENPEGDREKKQKYFDIIISEINRMENLIKNFLMISRPPRFDFLPNDIHVVLDEVTLMHRANAAQQNVMFHRKFFGKEAFANVDRDQMKQVFHNIVVNAMQAMPGGGELTILTSKRKMTLRDQQSVPAIRIEFADTGPGIPKDKIADIFEVYYTMKKTGTGLGLAIARQIIEGHMGNIRVKSEPGQGTRMIIDLPEKVIRIVSKENNYINLE